MGDLLLGIDVGTSSCKCCLLDADGNVLGSAAQEYSPCFPKPGWVEQDPSDWYRACVASLQRLAQQTDIPLSRIGAVGTTGQMRGATFLDRSGATVRRSILWSDLRCELEVAELKASCAELLQRITHNPINTMCTLPKLLWVMRHEPETWERTAALIYPKDYINFRLTGSLATDLSDASGSSFYDLESQTWSREILDLFSISPRKLPELYPSYAVVGTVSRAARLETGLAEGTPVTAGGSDATVELLAIGVENARQCKIRLGTSGALSTVIDRLDNRLAQGYYCWSYLIPGHWMIDVNTRACANSTLWLKDVFFSEMRDSEAAYRLMEQEAASVPLGAEGLFFHPYLLGEDAPYWQAHLKGSFFGLTLAHRRAHCVRAALEGTAFALRDARSVLGSLVNGFEEHIFVGGGVKNALWLSIVADVLGVNGRSAVHTDAALGAAMIAGIGTGLFSNIGEAIRKCSRLQGEVRHNAANHAAYSALFEKYVSMKRVFDAVYAPASD
jgi:xylulokinase